MERIRFNKNDIWFVVICLVILAAGTWFSVRYFHTAFPEASIDFRYSKSEAGTIAEDFLKEMELTPPEDYHHASLFNYDDYAKTFLEKELGLEHAQQYFGHPVRLWYWMHRWFKAETKEEFSIYVTPEGEVVKLEHLIKEDAEGAEIEEDSARVIAEAFLVNTMKLDTTQLVFLEASKIGRPHRADWEFTYKAKGIEPVKDSDYRYKVVLLGNKVGSYKEYLRVPDTWSQSYRRLRSFNELANNFAGVGIFLTFVAVVSVFFIRFRRKDIRLKTALWFGIIAAALLYCTDLNGLPGAIYYYDTTTSWSGFLIQELILDLLASLGLGILIFILTASAETLYRRKYANRLSLSRMFSIHGLRTKTAFKNILLGITMTPFFFAYQIVFYWIANRSGGWSPADVPYTNLLSTAMPWLAVLFIGFMPSVSEEFLSRAFSIPFLQNAFKNRFIWLAVLIPAVIWGFGHAAYPSQPFWIRGAEVGFAGILIGVIMLRFGILPTLVWHYTVDAFYTAMLLFRSENPYFILTAAVATGLLAIPLLLAFLAYLRKGTFLPEKGNLNEDDVSVEPVPVKEVVIPEVEKPAEPSVYKPLGNFGRGLAVVLLIAGILLTLINIPKIGDFLQFKVTTEEAVQTFSDSLRASGWADPDTLQIAAFVDDSGNLSVSDSWVYLLKHSTSIRDFNHLADSTLGMGTWRLQAWKPENRLRYKGEVNARSGKIESLSPWLPEEMESDSLSKDSAFALVNAELRKRGIDLDNFKLESHYETKRPKRMDHSVIFEANEGDPRHIGEAKFRYSGSVQGNYVSIPKRPFYKIPEEWERSRKATTAIRSVRQVLIVVLIAGIIGWAVTLLVLLTRKGLVPWKKGFLYAIIPGVLSILSWCDTAYQFKQQYFFQIAQPWSVFKTGSYLTMAMSTAMIYLVFALGLAFLWGLYPKKQLLLRRFERNYAFLDSVLAIAGAIGLIIINRVIKAAMTNWNPSWFPFKSWGVSEYLGTPFPFGAQMNDVLMPLLITILLLSFVAHLWAAPMKKWWLRVLLILGLIVMQFGFTGVEPNEWAFQFISGALLVLFGWLAMKFFIDGNPVRLISMVLGLVLYMLLSQSIGTGYPPVIVQAWILAGLAAVALFIWLGVPRKTG